MSGDAIIQWENRDSVLAAWRRAPTIFREEFVAAVEGMGEILVGAVKQRFPSSDGVSVATVTRTDAIPTPGGVVVHIGDSCPFGEVLELGRSPGSAPPPSADLIPWVYSHRDYFGIETEEDAAGLAFVIARNIGRHGFKSAPDGPGRGWGMYRKAADQRRVHWQQIGAILARARTRITDRMNGGG